MRVIRTHETTKERIVMTVHSLITAGGAGSEEPLLARLAELLHPTALPDRPVQATDGSWRFSMPVVEEVPLDVRSGVRRFDELEVVIGCAEGHGAPVLAEVRRVATGVGHVGPRDVCRDIPPGADGGIPRGGWHLHVHRIPEPAANPSYVLDHHALLQRIEDVWGLVDLAGRMDGHSPPESLAQTLARRARQAALGFSEDLRPTLLLAAPTLAAPWKSHALRGLRRAAEWTPEHVVARCHLLPDDRVSVEIRFLKLKLRGGWDAKLVAAGVASWIARQAGLRATVVVAFPASGDMARSTT